MDNLSRIPRSQMETTYVTSLIDLIYNARGAIEWIYNGGEERNFQVQESEQSKQGTIPHYILFLDEHGKMFGSMGRDRKFKYSSWNGILKDHPIVRRTEFLVENADDPSQDIAVFYRKRRYMIKQQEEQQFPTRYPKCTQLIVWHHKEHKYYIARYWSQVRGEDRFWVILLHEQGKSEDEPYDIDNAMYKAFPQYCRPKR